MSDPAPTRKLVLWVEKFPDPDDESKTWWDWKIYYGEDVHTYLDDSSEWFYLKRDAVANGRLALQAWQLAEGELLDILYVYMENSGTDIVTMADVLRSLVEDMRARHKAGAST